MIKLDESEKKPKKKIVKKKIIVKKKVPKKKSSEAENANDNMSEITGQMIERENEEHPVSVNNTENKENESGLEKTRAKEGEEGTPKKKRVVKKVIKKVVSKSKLDSNKGTSEQNNENGDKTKSGEISSTNLKEESGSKGNSETPKKKVKVIKKKIIKKVTKHRNSEASANESNEEKVLEKSNEGKNQNSERKVKVIKKVIKKNSFKKEGNSKEKNNTNGNSQKEVLIAKDDLKSENTKTMSKSNNNAKSINDISRIQLPEATEQIPDTNSRKGRNEKSIQKPESQKENKVTFSKNIKSSKSIDAATPTVISELPRNPIPVQLSHVNVIFIFLQEEYYIQVKSRITIRDFRYKICSMIKQDIEKMDIEFNYKIISPEDDGQRLLDYIEFTKLKSRPVFIVKKRLRKASEFEFINAIYQQGYIHKVHIENFPNLDVISQKELLLNVIEGFFDKVMMNKDYTYEIDTKGGFYVCFQSSDLAFDFNRYMTYIKATEEKFKNSKITLLLNPSRKATRKVRHNRNSSSIGKRTNPVYSEFLGGGEYMSEEDRRRKEFKESKKKWVCDQDFILSIGKYSGIAI